MRGERWGERSTGLSQARDRLRPELRQLAGMSNEPALELSSSHFQMKLQGESPVFPGERLIWRNVGRCQKLSGIGKIERVTVPVQHGLVLDGREWMPHPVRFRELQRTPTDLALTAGVDFGPESTGDELRSETDAERGPALVEATLDQMYLLCKKGVQVFFVGGDWTTEHDHEISVLQLLLWQFVDRNIEDPNLEISSSQEWFQQTKRLERNVSKDETSAHRGPPIG